MNIILTGMRGVGKSAIGRRLADRMGREFVEMDDVIEERNGRKISEIVAADGWGMFRKLEHELCVELSERDGLVISTGGGTLIFERNVAVMKGVVILLKCDLKVSARRISGDENRPSLTGGKSAVEELKDVWNERKEKYEAVADLVYETDNGRSIEAQVEEIVELLSAVE